MTDMRELKAILLQYAEGQRGHWSVPEPSALAYGREILFQDGKIEVIAVHLPAGVETPIHDHGGSVGCVLVVEGLVENRSFRKNCMGAVELTGVEYVLQDEFISTDKGTIHSMANPRKTRAVSLHAYAPPMSKFRNYYEISEYAASYI